MTKRLVPCSTCPFRSDNAPFFFSRPERAREIVRGLTVPDQKTGMRRSFMCHATLDYGNEDLDDDGESHARTTPASRWCNGALIVMRKEGILFDNEMARIAAILKLFHPSQLDLTAPVPDSLEDWVKLQEDGSSSRPARPDKGRVKSRLNLQAEAARRDGCILLRRSRETGHVVGLYHSAKAGMEDDPATPYTTVCEEHNTLVSHSTRRRAYEWLAEPTTWCEDCRTEKQA